MNVVAHDMATDCRTLHRPLAVFPGGIAASIVRTVGLWRARIGDRQAIAALDHRDLRDLRISRWELEQELAKPFWRG